MSGDTIDVSGIAFDFLGSFNYTATAQYLTYNNTHKVMVKYSKFNTSYPYNINWYDILFRNYDKNVSPAGQTQSRPIWNISSKAYDEPMDVYVKTNDTLDSCLNITYSNSSLNANLSYGYDYNVDYTFKESTTYQKVLSNVDTFDWKGVYNWWDFTNCTSIFYMPWHYFSSLCSDCYFDINQLDYYQVIAE